MRPYAAEIAGVLYSVPPGQDTYREYAESTVVRQAEIAGASRVARTSRPDVLEWRWDDWVGGEGEAHLDPNDELSPTRYLSSTAGVEISTPGQLELGRNLTTSVTLAGAIDNGGPHLCVAGGYVFVLYGIGTSLRIRRLGTAPTTWDAEVTLTGSGAGAVGGINGPPAVLGSFIFAAGDNRIIRIDTTPATSPAATDWVGSAGAFPVATNNRLYYTVTTAGNTELRRVDVSPSGSAPFTPYTAYTAAGLTSGRGLAAVGEQIWILNQETGDDARLHLFEAVRNDETDVGREKAKAPPGFRVDGGGPNINDVNNIIFYGGYKTGSGDEVDTPLVRYATEEAEDKLLAIRPGTSDRVTVIVPTTENEVLIGCYSGAVYRYDLEAGGLSLFLSGNSNPVTSIAFLDGRYYVATLSGTTGAVLYTPSTGASKHPTTSTVVGETWDFGFPGEPKTLTTVDVQTETLPSGTSVEVSLLLDDGTTITTDAAGVTMAHSTGTRSTFVVSNAGTERNFYYVRPSVILKGSGTTTPTVVAVTVRCETSGMVRFFEVVVDLSDDTSNDRLPDQMLNGKQKADNLRTLISNATSRSTSVSKLFTFRPLFADTTDAYPGPSDDTSYVCKLVEPNIVLDEPAQGNARLILKVVE